MANVANVLLVRTAVHTIYAPIAGVLTVRITQIKLSPHVKYPINSIYIRRRRHYKYRNTVA
jgi:hypothetical protein